MKFSTGVLALVHLLFSAAAACAAPVWHAATEFEIEGRGWTNTASPYHRLPSDAKDRVPESVWGLARHSAGLAVRFETTADRVQVRWTLADASLAMPHMPATGVGGVDLYQRGAGQKWTFVQNGRPVGRENNLAGFDLGASTNAHECLLYLPLYNGVEKLEIGIEPGAEIRPAQARRANLQRPVVFYGTSIVQGGCASRPGLAHVAILGRMLDRPVVNLGFSGAGRMEPGVVGMLAELDPAAFVIDCVWNITDLEPAEVERRVVSLVKTLRAARPRVPIVLVAQSNIRPERHPTPGSMAQEKAAKVLRDAGDFRLAWIDGAMLLGTDGEGTVDGVHPNDLGMMRQAQAMFPVVRRSVEDW